MHASAGAADPDSGDHLADGRLALLGDELSAGLPSGAIDRLGLGALHASRFDVAGGYVNGLIALSRLPAECPTTERLPKIRISRNFAGLADRNLSGQCPPEYVAICSD
jgi:hypothetical protein